MTQTPSLHDEWHNPDFAVHWDRMALIGNPTRPEQVDILVSFLADAYKEGTALLDLGMGSGLIEEQLFARRPDIYVVGIESSQPMMELAKRRLAPFQQNYQLIYHDLADFQRLALPSQSFPIIFSVQALHHLSYDQQQDLYRFLYKLLPPGGIFLLLDRINVDIEPFSDLYRSLWNRLERVSEIKSGISGDDFLQRNRYKKEQPASLEEQLSWLRQAGFDAICLHLHLNRALFAGAKNK